MYKYIFILVLFIWSAFPGKAQKPFFFQDVSSARYGLKDQQWNTILPAEYKEIFYQDEYLVTCKENRQCGLMDVAGNTILPCVYAGIRSWGKDTFLLSYNERYGLIYIGNKKIDTLLDFKYLLAEMHPDYLILHDGYKRGVINKKLVTIVPFEYDGINVEYYNYPFSEEQDYLRLHVAKNGKQGLVDTSSRVIIPAAYDVLWRTFNNTFSAQSFKENRTTIYSEQGQVIFASAASHVIYCRPDAIIVTDSSGRYGIIDQAGKTIIPFKFKRIQCERNGFWLAQHENGLWGSIDLDEKVILPFRFKAEPLFAFGYAAVMDDQRKWSVIDRTGKPIHTGRYDNAEFSGKGLFRIWEKNKTGYLDTTGHVLVPPAYDYVSPINQNYCIVRQGKKYSILKFQPALKESPQFDDISHDCFVRAKDSSKDLLLVKKDNKYGYINLEGEIIIPIQYERALSFKDNHASVLLNGAKLIIDKKGKVIATQ